MRVDVDTFLFPRHFCNLDLKQYFGFSFDNKFSTVLIKNYDFTFFIKFVSVAYQPIFYPNYFLQNFSSFQNSVMY